MANEQDIYTQTYKAATNLSAKRHYAAKPNGTAGQVALCGSDEKGIGIIQNIQDPATTGAVQVRELGRSKAIVDGNAAAIAAGDYLGSDANGKLIKVTADHKWTFARAEEASTADGDVIEVTVFPGFTLSV